MVNKKKFYTSILILVITLALFIVSVASIKAIDFTKVPDSFSNNTNFVNSNRYTQQDDLEVAVNQQKIDTSYKSFNTSLGKIYYSDESLALMFTNSNGYVISTTVGENETGLNKVWKKKATSAILITYYNADGSKSTEENILSSGKSTVTVVEKEDELDAHIIFGDSLIELDLIITFNENDFNVSIPFDSIIEHDYLLGTVSVYPFFGAVKNENIPGYIMVPDGVGALVRYKDANTNIISNYEKEFYSRDITYLSTDNLSNISENGANISVPVFGFVHGVNQNGIFANIKNGSEYGILNVYYAGVSNVDFTTVYSSFIYRKKYTQPIDKKGNTIYQLQSEINKFDVDIDYTVLVNEDANYVGMANCYKEYLKDTYGLKEKETEKKNTSILIETIGIEVSKGDFFNQRTVLTTLKEYQNIISNLKDAGIDNISGIINGFTDKGYSWSAPSYNSVSTSLGNKKDIEELQNDLDELYFNVEYVKASEKGGGYSTYTDLAKRINLKTYTYSDYDTAYYLLSGKKSLELAKSSIEKLSKKYGIDGYAISSIGNLIFKDYETSTSKLDLIKIYQEIAEMAKCGLYTPNSYLYNVIDAYFDMDIYSSQYITFDDTIPFLTIALNDFFEVYTTNANFYANAKDELLRVIDYNVGLSFVVTNKSSSELMETPLEYIYSSEAESLYSAIYVYYNYVNGALKNVINANIISRSVLSSGVMLNKYDNGVSIIVNYTNSDFIYNGTTIKAKDYGVIK